MPKKRKDKKEKNKKKLDPVEAIKRLFIVYLYKNNVSAREIGALLGVSYKTIERMIPKSLKHEKEFEKKKPKKGDTSTSK